MVQEDHEDKERRSGDDRRSGDERRSKEKPLTTDFRSGDERRASERRNVKALREILGGRILADAPIDTPVTYSRDEAAKIRAQVDSAADPIICPRCGQPLKGGPPISRRDDVIRELVCPDCRRCVMVKTKPE
jgi:DNA-directed RNA polymerase subunit RPC12/RpoP